MSQATTTAAAPRSRRRPLTTVLLVLVGLLGGAFVLFLATQMFGAVHGTEFCPQTFERRNYVFYELPWIGIQVSGIRHQDVTGTTETFVTGNYITAKTGGPQDWHLVLGSHGTKLAKPGDAHILIQYFDAKDSQDYHRWVKWSEDHPKLAKIFWPAVQRLAENELYVFVPDLFELAKSSSDPTKLQPALDQFVAAKLVFLALRLQEREEHAAAIKLLDAAAKLDPANQEVGPARDKSRAAAGEPEVKNGPAAKKAPATKKLPAEQKAPEQKKA